jgi:hypothetical protein
MEIDIVIQQVMEFVGMENWEQVHTFAAVCKFWRHSSLPHLHNIGKVPMDGGVERRLNIGAFLQFFNLSISEMCSVFLSLAGNQRDDLGR